jgi:hypothetical protein
MGRCKRYPGRGTLVGFRPELDGITELTALIMSRTSLHPAKKGEIRLADGRTQGSNKLENWVNKHKK